jgi:TRAP-type mannitol/chloroaromatic compound transport system permease small subunit
MRALLAFSRAVDAVNTRIGYLAAWCMLAAATVSCGNALIRYTFSRSSNFWLEIQWYLFGAMFMLGAAYTLKRNEHVRVDLVYGALPARARLWIDIVGTLLFLLPACLICGWLTYWFFLSSFLSGEESANAPDLLRWPAKIMFPLGFALLAIQGVSELIKRIEALLGLIRFDTTYEKPVQ